MSELPGTEGIGFASVQGKRSSQRAGRTIFAGAAAAVDATLAEEIERRGDWRKNYLRPVRDLVEAGTRSEKEAVGIAADGLRSVREAIVFHRGGRDYPLTDALQTFREKVFSSATIHGQNDREDELCIPYRNQVLSGETLEQQLGDWERRGVIEPSCGTAIRHVMSHPQWLDLSDLYVVLLGAASEMGPLSQLSRWSANVIAVDLPRPDLWQRIIEVAKQGSGQLHIPIKGPVPADASDLPAAAGADLLTETPEICTWVEDFQVPFVAGNYAYADGSRFALLAAGADSLMEYFLESRPCRSLAYLATPTDVFAVPAEVVRGAHEAQEQAGVIRGALGTLSRSKLFVPNYRDVIRSEDGTVWGISDCLVPQQGPNYAAAKMLQRWRATTSREAGHVTSANVAPATRTRSVVKNKVLATAYRGAHAYGVEIFEPATSRALMAALLVHDLRNTSAISHPDTPIAHPYELFTDAAAHGGLWRTAYEPRSVLPMAVVRGAFKKG